MTRQEKIRKLTNAIRRYRGKHNGRTVGFRWIVPPQPHEVAKVIRWVKELDLPIASSMEAIENFKTFDEFNKWLARELINHDAAEINRIRPVSTPRPGPDAVPYHADK